MSSFEQRENVPEDKKTELKRIAQKVLFDEPTLIISFNNALDKSTPEEISENYNNLINNPNNLKRVAINAYQFEALTRLKENIDEMRNISREVGKVIEPIERKSEENEGKLLF